LIVESHEARVRRSDAQKRRAVLTEVGEVIECFPGRSLCTVEVQSID